MVELSNAKIMGGIGAILMLLMILPSVGFIVFIIGIVLVFMAVKTISDLTKDKSIFNNYLMNFIFSILALVAVIAIMLIAFGAVGGFSWISSLETADITDFESFWAYFGGIIGACALALVIGWIMFIIAAIYLRKSYNSIAEHTKVNLFETTGLINLIGAITLIIGIGIIIIFIARIIEIIAYFSLPDKLPIETGNQKESVESHSSDE